MYQRRTSIAVLVLAFFALLGMASAPARADGAISQRFPILDQFDDNCNGEIVLISGTVHTVTKSTTNNDGSITYRLLVNFQDVHGVGVGSGLKYVIADNYQLTATAAPGSASFSQRLMVRVLSQGSADNEFLSVLITASYDPVNGYRYTFYFSDTCRG